MEKLDKYVSPEVEVIKCNVEQGFCISNVLDDPILNPEQPW